MKSKFVYVVRFEGNPSVAGIYGTATSAIDWVHSMAHLLDGFVETSRAHSLKLMARDNVIRIGVKSPATVTRWLLQ